MGGRSEKRGLYNLASTPDCLPQILAEKNVDLFTRHHIFTREELASRYEIFLENYVKTVAIEQRRCGKCWPKTSFRRSAAMLPLSLVRPCP